MIDPLRLPELLREAGIATDEQAEHLRRLIWQETLDEGRQIVPGLRDVPVPDEWEASP